MGVNAVAVAEREAADLKGRLLSFLQTNSDRCWDLCYSLYTLRGVPGQPRWRFSVQWASMVCCCFDHTELYLLVGQVTFKHLRNESLKFHIGLAHGYVYPMFGIS